MLKNERLKVAKETPVRSILLSPCYRVATSERDCAIAETAPVNVRFENHAPRDFQMLMFGAYQLGAAKPSTE